MALGGLQGKVAVVTGAAQGIGAATVSRLLEEGCRVVAADLVPGEQESRARNGDIVFVRTDVSNPEDCESCVRATVERHGSVHLLAHCAGIFAAVSPVASMDVEAFDRVMAVNVRGTMLILRAVLAQMIAAKHGGAIVCAASVSSFKAGAGRAAYGASKRAVLGIAAAAAIESGPHGIRVNSVAPGSTDTPMARNTGGLRESILANQRATPLGRIGQPEEIAAAIAWLLSDESSFVTGSVITADGGFLV